MSNRWASIRKQVFPSQVFPCAFCGVDCAWHSLKGSGARVQVAVDKEKGRMTIIIGAGNHKNFVPVHDCRAEAARMLPVAEQKLVELEAARKAAIATIGTGMRAHIKATVAEWGPDRGKSGLRQHLRKALAQNFRQARRILRGASDNLKSAREYVDYLTERATMTAVFLSK